MRTASLLVPRPQRAQWYQEWYGEVWHWLHFLAESGRLNAQTSMELARHCWGAFPDAAWHRFSQKKVVRAFEEVPRTARFCLGATFAALVFLVLVTGLAPTIRSGFKPLPFPQPDRLAYLSLHGSYTKYDEENLFRVTGQWAERSKTAEMVAGYSWHPVALIFPNGVVRDISARVSSNFFDLLGNKAAVGRLFAPGDDAGCVQCVVITHRLWTMQFNADRNIVGRTISVDGRPGTVVGVLPESFVFTFPEVSVWLLPRWGTTTNNFADRTGAVLRMAPHVTLAQAKQEFQRFADADGYAQPQMESFVSRAHQGAKLYL
ncbi:MAG: ABC transporter permease, partial [Terriglobales bacterium]